MKWCPFQCPMKVSKTMHAYEINVYSCWRFANWSITISSDDLFCFATRSVQWCRENVEATDYLIVLIMVTIFSYQNFNVRCFQSCWISRTEWRTYREDSRRTPSVLKGWIQLKKNWTWKARFLRSQNCRKSWSLISVDLGADPWGTASQCVGSIIHQQYNGGDEYEGDRDEDGLWSHSCTLDQCILDSFRLIV